MAPRSSAERKLLPNGEGPPRRRQAGVLHFDGHKQGVLDQQAGWRSGSDQPWTIDGSPTRASAPRSPERRDGPAGAWRSGDSSAFSFHEDKPEHQSPQMRREASAVASTFAHALQ